MRLRFINTTPTFSPNGATITGSTIQLQYANTGYPGLLSTAAQYIQGVKTLTGLLTASASVALNGGAINLNTDSNTDTNINTGTSTGAVTIGGSQLVVKNTTDSTTAFAIKNVAGATVFGVDTTNSSVGINAPLSFTEGSDTVFGAYSVSINAPARLGLLLQAVVGQAVDIFRIQDSATNNLFNVMADGRVGIGANFPSQLLDVNGDANSNTDLYVGNTLRIDSAGNFLNIRDLNVIGNTSLIKPTVDSAAVFQVQDASATNLLNIDTTNGIITVGTAGTSQFINNASTTNATLELPDFPTGGSIGTPTTTVDTYTNINITQTTPNQTLTLPDPTNTTAGRTIYITNTGTTTFTLLDNAVPANTGVNALWNGMAWVIGTAANSGVNTVSTINDPMAPNFAPKVDYTTGSGPRSVASADINADGKSDVLVANNTSNTASVFINNGDGTFAAKVDYATGTSPASITAADINADGKPDMLVANSGSDTASVLINNGDGTFAAKVDYTTGSSPNSIAAGYVNGDSNLDMMVLNYNSSKVSVLINNGDGTFAAKVDYSAGSNPRGIAVNDVNGDGKVDILVSGGGSGSASVLINNGNGTFAAKVDYATGSNPYCVFVADVNNDGKPDMLVGNQGSNTVSVLINNGNGTFAAKVDYATGSGIYGITSADVNADGSPDMLAVGFGLNVASVFINNGNGTFAARTNYATGSSPYGITVADVNADSKQDMIIVNSGSNSISVLMNINSLLSSSGSVTQNNLLKLQYVGVNNSGIVSLGAQIIQGAKTFNGQLITSAGVTLQGGDVSLNVDSNDDTNINTGTSTGIVTIGGNSAVLKPTNDSSQTLQIQNASTANLLSVDSTNMQITMASLTVSTSLTLSGGHVLTAGTTPTKTDGAAACTVPTITVDGNDTAGTISVTTGTGCTVTGTLATINFATAFGVNPKVKFTPANSNAADLKFYNGARSTSSFTLDTATIPTATTEYIYNYLVVQ